MNNRPKDPKTARNKNVLVIGGSGSGKTRFFVKPNLMQCVSKDYPTSFVITDPKGSLIGEVGQLLIRSGYRVKVLNTINFSKSMKYNPFRYLHSEKDVLKLVNKGEELAERQAGKAIRSGIRRHKLKPYRAAAKAEKKAIAANAEYIYRKSLRDNPEMAQAVKNPVARFWQKQKIKRDYAKAARAAGQTAQGAASATKTTAAAAKKAAEKSKQAASFVARHWKGVLLIGGVGLMLMLIMGGLQSCTAMFGSAGTGVAATSYLSGDSDMLGAEAAYADMEADLQYELDNYESLHPGYDEYRFDLDEIGHDPYVLTSILSALHEGVYTLGDVQGNLAMLFEKQYTLTQTIETETRYRTETRTDSEGNTYTVQVPYTYYICNVKLENFDMSHLPVYIMGEEQMSLYAVYMHTLGNRPDLFPNGTYPNASTVKEPTYYDIPPEALEDATFAAMMAEAEKYVGYPYGATRSQLKRLGTCPMIGGEKKDR